MELKQLNYFVRVAQEGTISAAARKLNLTQPPLSAQMKLLEQEVGCPLFERGSRRIQLTEAGRMLYNRAVTMLEFADITRQELKDYLEGTSGTLRLGVVSSVGSTYLTQIVSRFHKEHPQIAFELTEANTYQLLEQLSANLLELAIVRTPFPEQGFVSVRLLDEPMLAVGHRQYFVGPAHAAEPRHTAASADDSPMTALDGSPDAAVHSAYMAASRPVSPARIQHAPSLSLSALSDKPLIIYRRWEEILRKRFQSLRIEPDIFCKNDDARTSALWADEGLGVAILPASTAGLLCNPQTLIYQIDDRRLCSGICAVHNKDAWLSAIAKSFLSYLEKTPPFPL